MQTINSFFKRITDDLKQKKLIPVKLLFFVHASTLYVLYPYLTIHMRELGINVGETAIMSAVIPVVSIVMPPLAGMLADKIGNFKLLLALSSVLGGAAALLLLLVPVGRLTITYPTDVELLTSCDDSALRIRHVQEYPCLPLHPYSYDINLTVLSCGFICDVPTPSEINKILEADSYDIHLHSNLETQRLVYRNTLSSHFTKSNTPTADQSTARILYNNPFFNVTVSKISDREIYFPAPKLYDIQCSTDSSNGSCAFGSNDIFQQNEKVSNKTFRMRVSHDAQNSPKNVRNYWVTALSSGNNSIDKDYGGVDSVTCSNRYDEVLNESGVRVQVGSQQLLGCSTACTAITPRKALCVNTQQPIEIDPSLTFWAYLAVRVTLGIIGGTAFAMFEGAVIAIVREQKADYGLQRAWGSIGGMISSPLSGLLIDYASRGKSYTDFRPAFYLYAILKMASGVLMLSIDLEFKQPAQNLLQDVITVFKNVEIVALFIVCFILGTTWGYIESFLFWLLEDLGASRSLMGITITVGGIAGIPLLVLSGPIIKKVGHANVLFIGFIFYAIRLLGYSLIYNPWYCLVFEAMESVTASLAITAAVTYAAKLSTTTTDTSVQGLLGGIYYGVGKGSGSLIGGYLMKFFGTRPTYQMFAGSALVTGCMYFLFNKFYMRKRINRAKKDECTKQSTDIENAKASDKNTTPLDVVTDKQENEKSSDSNHNKLGPQATDGGSDSGVENPAYNESEPVREVKKEENK